jgi:hypothetical protein
MFVFVVIFNFDNHQFKHGQLNWQPSIIHWQLYQHGAHDFKATPHSRSAKNANHSGGSN